MYVPSKKLEQRRTICSFDDLDIRFNRLFVSNLHVYLSRIDATASLTISILTSTRSIGNSATYFCAPCYNFANFVYENANKVHACAIVGVDQFKVKKRKRWRTESLRIIFIVPMRKLPFEMCQLTISRFRNIRTSDF